MLSNFFKLEVKEGPEVLEPESERGEGEGERDVEAESDLPTPIWLVDCSNCCICLGLFWR